MLATFGFLTLLLALGNCQLNDSNDTVIPPPVKEQRTWNFGCRIDDPICMPLFTCRNQGGRPNGYCGLNVCCDGLSQCNQISRLKRTIIKNPVQLTTNICRQTIRAYNSNVCQLKIEFIRFELPQPTVVNNALVCGDRLEFGKYTLCGDNTGQIFHIPFRGVGINNEFTLTFNLPNRSPQSNWNLVVTQLECPRTNQRSNVAAEDDEGVDLRVLTWPNNNDFDSLAPMGCDQYYTQPTGNIKSLNFNSVTNTRFMSNIKYVICVKQPVGATTIEYNVRKFSLSNTAGETTFYDSSCHSTIFTAGRRDNYLLIPQSFLSTTPTIQPTYYCGTALPDNQIVIAAAPFFMLFSSDAQTDARETGFSIDYRVRT